MSKTCVPESFPSCGCNRACRCQRELRYRCHDYNALLAPTLRDYGWMHSRNPLR